MAKGYVIAAVLGVVIGFLMARVRVVYALLEPVLELLRPIPIVAYIPLLIFYLGIGSQMKITVVVVAAFFPSSSTPSRAARRSRPRSSTPPARSGWAGSRRCVRSSCRRPLRRSSSGCDSPISISLVVAVVTGMIAGASGVGYYLLLAQQSFSVVNIFAGGV